MRYLPKFDLAAENEMRAFLIGCGISEKTTEAAIAQRRKNPALGSARSSPLKGLQRKRGPTGKVYFVPRSGARPR